MSKDLNYWKQYLNDRKERDSLNTCKCRTCEDIRVKETEQARINAVRTWQPR